MQTLALARALAQPGHLGAHITLATTCDKNRSCANPGASALYLNGGSAFCTRLDIRSEEGLWLHIEGFEHAKLVVIVGLA